MAMEKVNAQLFTLTYGAMVTQLVKDYETSEAVNKQLDDMGYNIGIRIVDEFFAKAPAQRCGTFKEAIDTIAKVGFRLFLDITADVSWKKEHTDCILTLPAVHPLADFVELPESCKDLKYSNVLCGVLRGALEMIRMRVTVTFERDVLCGDAANELRVVFDGLDAEVAGDEYKDD